ncbi:undecaprenyl-phosphate glucose phosphotransferase [Sphingobium sp. YR768]|uniref:undecaprenyl-phosphate glucose phosphotransferase n=1 Tax=Sphingobium sp. YR768 TaxID=1884365 RepID=UPI0008B13F36|nr:undecaprenyl-phosphate glucose phosphotransferase [Sphingobium sp. YR768]SER95920.1 Undecaprenyl-phosphate glucose phosphotransferase [Sphingobium sp. YR768]
MPVHLSNLHLDGAESILAPQGAYTVGQLRSIPVQCVHCVVVAADIGLIFFVSLIVEKISFPFDGDDMMRFDRIGVLAAGLFAIIAHLVGAYELPVHFSVRQSLLRAANAWVGVLLFVFGLSTALLDFSGTVAPTVLLWAGACALALLSGRVIMVAGTRVLRRRGLFNQRSAMIGTGSSAARLVRYISQHKILTLSLIGVFGDAADLPDQDQAGLPYLGDLTALLCAIRAGTVDRVIIALPSDQESRVRTIVARLSETPVEIRLLPANDSFSWMDNPVVMLGEIPVFTLLDWPLSRRQRLLKALEDRLLAFVALLLLMPLMGMIALAIRLESPGPALFRQQRQGYNCRNFAILKFRTMYQAKESVDGVRQAQRHDPRVTRLGAILRRTSLDELPQLLNVLIGDMSLVGPRPHAPSTRAAGRLFGEIAQAYPSRHNVKPGMTGWAQVCGWRGETNSEAQLLGRLEHDLYYARNWSLWFDLRIMFRTIATVLGQQNAY